MAEEPNSKPGSGGFSSAVNGGRTVEECQDMIGRSLRSMFLTLLSLLFLTRGLGFWVFHLIICVIAVPMVKFLKEHMEKAGCRIGDMFIKAVHCDKQISGGYVRGEGVFILYLHLWKLK